MSNVYKVTKAGLAQVQDGIKLTAAHISLAHGTGESAWTTQSTFHGGHPVDSEGWAPWGDGLRIPDLEAKGYIVEVGTCK